MKITRKEYQGRSLKREKFGKKAKAAEFSEAKVVLKTGR
jgi:hypothetical protein